MRGLRMAQWTRRRGRVLFYIVAAIVTVLAYHRLTTIGVVGCGEGVVYLTSPERTTDTGLQLGRPAILVAVSEASTQISTGVPVVTIAAEDFYLTDNGLIPSARRASKTRYICSKPGINKLMGRFPTYEMRQLIVDEKKNVAFCFVPKVACTNFKRVFLGLAGIIRPRDIYNLTGRDVHLKHIHHLKLLKDYSLEERSNITGTYKKFVFVRDPLERLLSAFRNKFVNHPKPARRAEFFKLIQIIYKEFPTRRKERNIPEYGNVRNSTITFENFLYYILDHLELKGQVDLHFVPIATLCDPCNIKYHYIGNYDNLKEETEEIFSELSIDYAFPPRKDNYSSIETRQVVESYYTNLPPNLVRSIWEVYKQDYIIFNLPIPKWLLKFNIDLKWN